MGFAASAGFGSLGAMATTKKRTTRPGTRPLTPKQRELRVALRAARERGEDPAGVVYEAMTPEEKRAFVRLHAT